MCTITTEIVNHVVRLSSEITRLEETVFHRTRYIVNSASCALLIRPNKAVMADSRKFCFNIRIAADNTICNFQKQVYSL